jgi:hypothetical protein
LPRFLERNVRGHESAASGAVRDAKARTVGITALWKLLGGDNEIEIAGSREGSMGTSIAAKEDERRDVALVRQDLELVAFRP